MGKETKEKGKQSGKKITQFPTQLDVQEELEDVAMDRFLRQSIIEDADRIERELNEDPKLIGIGASDDLFGKIVEELKTKGIWEGDKETNVDEKSDPVKEEQQKSAIYDMLSEADREALAFGYQMQKKEQERKEKRKKRNRRLKHVSAAVVALVFVGGIGVSTEASRRWVLQMRDVVLSNFGTSKKNNFVEEIDKVRILSTQEEEIENNIRNKLKIAPVRFMYLPKEMECDTYEINEEASYAMVQYLYKGMPFTMQIWGNEEENVAYNQIDGDIQEETGVVTEQNIKINIYKIVENGDIFYKADFFYEDNYYYFKGMLKYEEFKKIMIYLFVLEE